MWSEYIKNIFYYNKWEKSYKINKMDRNFYCIIVKSSGNWEMMWKKWEIMGIIE